MNNAIYIILLEKSMKTHPTQTRLQMNTYHPDMDITQLAKTNNWFVNGLNHTYSGENYVFKKLTSLKNKIKASIDITSHLFCNENDYIHLSMTLALRIILDALKIYLTNKCLSEIDEISIHQLDSIKINRIQALKEINLEIIEAQCIIDDSTYEGIFLITFNHDEIVLEMKVSSKINESRQETFDFSSIVSSNTRMLFTPKFDIPQKKLDQKLDFSLLFNMIVNSIFIYASWDNQSLGKNRFILGSKINYSGKDLLLKEMDQPISIKMIKKFKRPDGIYYKSEIKNESNLFIFHLSFLYRVM